MDAIASGTHGPLGVATEKKRFDDGTALAWWLCPLCGRIAGSQENGPWLCACGVWLRAEDGEQGGE